MRSQTTQAYGKKWKGTRELCGLGFSFAVFEVFLAVLAVPHVLEQLPLPHGLETPFIRKVIRDLVIDFSDERCLKSMGQRKLFEYVRHSEDGKEHLKYCKAEPKATQLTGTFPFLSVRLCCLRPHLLCRRPGASLAS